MSPVSFTEIRYREGPAGIGPAGPLPRIRNRQTLAYASDGTRPTANEARR